MLAVPILLLLQLIFVDVLLNFGFSIYALVLNIDLWPLG